MKCIDMKKTLRTAISVFSATLLVLAIITLVMAVLTKLMGNSIFPYTMHYVVSGSMEPEIKAGDLVIAKKTDIEDVKIGDYVVFVSPDPKLNKITIIHSVVDIAEDEQGIKLTTQGIKEGLSPDEYPVREIIGVYYCKSATIGFLADFFASIRNILFLAIVTTALIVIIKSSKDIVKAIKERKNGAE